MNINEKKQEAILFFLNKYGILIDFDDDSYLNYKKRISLAEDATFKNWKFGTFGNTNAQILVYGCHSPANNKRFANIRRNNNAKNMLKVFEFHKDVLEEKSKVDLYNEKKKLKTIPKETLEDCIEEEKAHGGLEPTVAEFFQKYLDDTTDDVDAKQILSRLIHAYNFSVSQFNRING